MRCLGLAIVFLTLGVSSCATGPVLPLPALDFFHPAGPSDPWNRKIANWQARHQLDPVRRGEAPSHVSSLGESYDAFENELRRQVAADTMVWVQANSKDHYRPDGARDHWATLGEVIRSGEDDCDGLDLLTFVLLRRLGFEESEIYRAIIVEEGTAQHHMVTLWFENGNRDDPFVLDPTGVVTPEMVRMSAIPDWEPIELFDEQDHYSVRSTTRTRIVASE